jgi:hypothetical protein
MVAESVATTESAAHTKRGSEGGESRFDRTEGDVTFMRSSRQPVRNHAVVAAPMRTAPNNRLRRTVLADIADTR